MFGVIHLRDVITSSNAQNTLLNVVNDLVVEYGKLTKK